MTKKNADPWNSSHIAYHCKNTHVLNFIQLSTQIANPSNNFFQTARRVFDILAVHQHLAKTCFGRANETHQLPHALSTMSSPKMQYLCFADFSTTASLLFLDLSLSASKIPEIVRRNLQPHDSQRFIE